MNSNNKFKSILPERDKEYQNNLNMFLEENQDGDDEFKHVLELSQIEHVLELSEFEHALELSRIQQEQEHKLDLSLFEQDPTDFKSSRLIDQRNDNDNKHVFDLSLFEQHDNFKSSPLIDRNQYIDDDTEFKRASKLSLIENNSNDYKLSTLVQYYNSFMLPNNHLRKLLNIFQDDNENIWKIWDVVGDGKCMIYAVFISISCSCTDLNVFAWQLIPTLKNLINEDTSLTYSIDCNDEIIIFSNNDSDAVIVQKLNKLHATCNNLPTSYLILLQRFFGINILLLTIDSKSVRPYTYQYYESDKEPNTYCEIHTNEIIILNNCGHYFILFTDSTTFQDNWVKNFKKVNKEPLW
jgi:hypothetical protein